MCPIDFITAVAADAFHEQRAENNPVIAESWRGRMKLGIAQMLLPDGGDIMRANPAISKFK